MTFFDWLILSLFELVLVFTAFAVCVGASIVALILLVRDCVEKRYG